MHFPNSCVHKTNELFTANNTIVNNIHSIAEMKKKKKIKQTPISIAKVFITLTESTAFCNNVYF